MRNYEYYSEERECHHGTVGELFYEIKDYYLTEIELSEERYLYIRQWKDIPSIIEKKDRTFNMNYGVVYLTDGITVYDIWEGWGEKELEEWLDKCREKEMSLIKKDRKEQRQRE